MTAPTPEQFAAYLAQMQAQQAQQAVPQTPPQFQLPAGFNQFAGPAAQQFQPSPQAFPAPVPAEAPVNLSLDDFVNQQASAGGASLPVKSDTPIGTQYLVRFAANIDKTHIRPQEITENGVKRLARFADGTVKPVMVAPVVVVQSNNPEVKPGAECSWWVKGPHWDKLKAAMGTAGASYSVPRAGDAALVSVTGHRKIQGFSSMSTQVEVQYQLGGGAAPTPEPAVVPAPAPAAPPAPISPLPPAPVAPPLGTGAAAPATPDAPAPLSPQAQQVVDNAAAISAPLAPPPGTNFSADQLAQLAAMTNSTVPGAQ